MKHIEELYIDVINFSSQHDGNTTRISVFRKDLRDHLKKIWKAEAEKSMRSCSLINRNHVIHPVSSQNIKSVFTRSKAQIDEIKNYIHRLKGEDADIPEEVKHLELVSTEIGKIVDLFGIALKKKMVLEECLEVAMKGDFSKIINLDSGSKTLEDKIRDDYENRIDLIKNALKSSQVYPYEKIKKALTNDLFRIKRKLNRFGRKPITEGLLKTFCSETLFEPKQLETFFLGSTRGESGIEFMVDPEKEIDKIAQERSDSYCESYGKKIIRMAKKIELEERSKGEISVSDIKIARSSIEIKCSLKIEGKFHDISFNNRLAFNANVSNMDVEFGRRDKHLDIGPNILMRN